MTPFSIARDASISARSRAAARPAALPALLCKRRSNAASGGSPPRHSPLSFRLSGGAQSGQNILPTPGPSVRGRKKMRVHIKGVCTGQRQMWQLCAQSPDVSGSEQTPQPTHDVCVPLYEPGGGGGPRSPALLAPARFLALGAARFWDLGSARFRAWGSAAGAFLRPLFLVGRVKLGHSTLSPLELSPISGPISGPFMTCKASPRLFSSSSSAAVSVGLSWSSSTASAHPASLWTLVRPLLLFFRVFAAVRFALGAVFARLRL